MVELLWLIYEEKGPGSLVDPAKAVSGFGKRQFIAGFKKLTIMLRYI